jgi:hypothetical protein
VRLLLTEGALPAAAGRARIQQTKEGLMKKVAALATVVFSLAGTAVFGVTHASASTACVSASAQVNVNGSDVVNQSVDQCTP